MMIQRRDMPSTSMPVLDDPPSTDEIIGSRLRWLFRASRDDLPPAPRANAVHESRRDDIPLRIADLAGADGTSLAVISCQQEIGRISIGRARNAQIQIEDPHVSRIHAEIRWDNGAGAHVLNDLRSANGTYIDGRRIRGEVHLCAGMRLRFGRTELHYQRSDSRET